MLSSVRRIESSPHEGRTNVIVPYVLGPPVPRGLRGLTLATGYSL